MSWSELELLVAEAEVDAGLRRSLIDSDLVEIPLPRMPAH